jgi:RND family efflux transporter MFP subunit
MRHITLALVVMSAAVGLVGCRGNKPAPAPPPPPRVTVIRPVLVNVSDYWVYNGYLETTKAVEVRSKVRGFLKKIDFEEGTEVKEGRQLYEIDKVEFLTAQRKAAAEDKKAEAELIKAGADIKNWEAQIVEAKTELTRMKTAVASGGESETNLVKAQALYDVRVAELAAAKANKDAAKANKDATAQALHSTDIMLGYTDITAKIGGRISRTLVDEGNLVIADTTLLTTIVKVDELFVYFDAPEADLFAFQQAMLASQREGDGKQQIRVEVGVAKEDGFPHEGRIDFRENRVDTGTGTVRIRGRIENPLGVNDVRVMAPGMYARVRVPKGAESKQWSIPEDCLLSAQEGQFVYVIGPDKKVQKRLVTVGATVWKTPAPVPGAAPPSWVAVNPTPPAPKEGQPPPKTRRQVRSVVAVTFHIPLAENERVILEGLQKTKPDDTVEPEEWTLTPPAK